MTEIKRLQIDPTSVYEGSFNLYAKGRGESEGKLFGYLKPAGKNLVEAENALVNRKHEDEANGIENNYVVGLGVVFDAGVKGHIVYPYNYLGLWKEEKPKEENKNV